MDGGEEVSCGLVITGRDSAELFELAKEVLDPVACLIEVFIIITLHLAIRFGRNYCHFSGLRQRLQHPLVGIVALIGNHDRRLERRQQDIGSVQITGLAGRQYEASRMTQGIDGSMNLGAQSASAASDRLVFPLFF
jgi:hypothetical protein